MSSEVPHSVAEAVRVIEAAMSGGRISAVNLDINLNHEPVWLVADALTSLAHHSS